MRRIKMTPQQLIMVLETEPLKLPITIVMRGIDKQQMQELVKFIKSKSKSR